MKIIAERTKWMIVSPIILWILTAVLLAASILICSVEMNYKAIMLPIMCGLIFVLAVVYTYYAISTPKTLAEYSNGMLYFYPDKSKRIAVRPQDIIFIYQKNYSGRGITYSSGTIKIELVSEIIVLKWVKNVDDTRRKIESLKQIS